jgi:hypothetical protein
MMTPKQQVEASRALFATFVGVHPGDTISILAVTLQMAICYGARTKEAAVDMITRIAEDSIHGIPQQYDLVQKVIKDAENSRDANDAGRSPIRH